MLLFLFFFFLENVLIHVVTSVMQSLKVAKALFQTFTHYFSLFDLFCLLNITVLISLTGCYQFISGFN